MLCILASIELNTAESLPISSLDGVGTGVVTGRTSTVRSPRSKALMPASSPVTQFASRLFRRVDKACTGAVMLREMNHVIATLTANAAMRVRSMTRLALALVATNLADSSSPRLTFHFVTSSSAGTTLSR
ncbi:MAG: hypothetical protein SNJ74_08220 [Fimbriimonadaceae bacterium]